MYIDMCVYIHIYIYIHTGWRRVIRSLTFIDHFWQKSPQNSESFPKMTYNLRLHMSLRQHVYEYADTYIYVYI